MDDKRASIGDLPHARESSPSRRASDAGSASSVTSRSSKKKLNQIHPLPSANSDAVPTHSAQSPDRTAINQVHPVPVASLDTAPTHSAQSPERTALNQVHPMPATSPGTAATISSHSPQSAALPASPSTPPSQGGLPPLPHIKRHETAANSVSPSGRLSPIPSSPAPPSDPPSAPGCRPPIPSSPTTPSDTASPPGRLPPIARSPAAPSDTASAKNEQPLPPWGGGNNLLRKSNTAKDGVEARFPSSAHQTKAVDLVAKSKVSAAGGSSTSITERCSPFAHNIADEVGLANYIPFRNADLIKQLQTDFPNVFQTQETRDKFANLCKWLSLRNMLRMSFQFGDVYDDYVYVDPDNIDSTPGAGLHDVHDSEKVMTRFSELFHKVLDMGDFDEVPQEILESAFKAQNGGGGILGTGLQVCPVDTDVIDFHVWYRGKFVKEIDYRTWRTWFMKVKQDVTIFSRLVIMFRERPKEEIEYRRSLSKKPNFLCRGISCFMAWLRNDSKYKVKLKEGKIYLKLFKDAQDTDVDLLLPGVTVKFSWLDYTIIFGAMAFAIGAAVYKASKGTLNFDTIAAIATALVLILMPVWGAVSGYLRMKDKRIMLQSYMGDLYMLSCISSNAGVVAQVLDETGEQEDNEAMLAYFFLWKGMDDPLPRTKEELDKEVEQYIKGLMRKQVIAGGGDEEDMPALDFEVLDSLHKLKVMNILEKNEGNQYEALPLTQALERAHVKMFEEEREGKLGRTGKTTGLTKKMAGLKWHECMGNLPVTGQQFRYFWNQDTGESTYTQPPTFLPMDHSSSH